ncbi:MAG: LuxR C-terminal-related transcriptional regulator [Methylococcales bacterium]|nr:LuxR C-terminal-related transcriptional regulator [Methylococcales bacterium]
MQKMLSESNKASLELRLKILAPRERETFELLIFGYDNTELLETLKISLPTTKQYKTAVLRKLNISSLAEHFDLQRLS